MTYSVLMLRKPGNGNRICRFYLPQCFCFIFACRRANTDRPRADGKSFEAVQQKKNAEKAADTQTLHEGCLTNVEFE